MKKLARSIYAAQFTRDKRKLLDRVWLEEHTPIKDVVHDDNHVWFKARLNGVWVVHRAYVDDVETSEE